jgi:hypothetical protein
VNFRTLGGLNPHCDSVASPQAVGKSFPPLAFGSCHAARPSFFFRRMSEILTADLLALDTDGLKSRLSKLRRYL